MSGEAATFEALRTRSTSANLSNTRSLCADIEVLVSDVIVEVVEKFRHMWDLVLSTEKEGQVGIPAHPLYGFSENDIGYISTNDVEER